ncbi:lysophospholipase L1-like esterase [Lipingzhangella halophila]|uniref:Lysophospholipase L1-like esterase n=1 Tax=Lipingzhangella halophila TaxID=1783352 RepID=A0A7W7W5J0_9ACTN|nr:GDSL-type esterase/lipase family protein [Lipingzhangella halophila]MBB4933840.1 lysophospholipase L1-like esterase [Lipingzhangella halophila]
MTTEDSDGQRRGPLRWLPSLRRPRRWPSRPAWLRLPRRRRTGGTGGEGAGRKPRLQPTPLGLFGIMLAAMFLTLLLIQTFLGDFRAGEELEEDNRTPSVDATPPEGTARIMVAGDSTVQGSSGDHTWRYRLWTHLDERSGADVEFVGPYDDLLDVNTDSGGNQEYADPGFDRAHAARWGATAEEIAADIGEHVAEHEPHYLLLVAGVNDLVTGDSAQDALDHLAEAVVTARVGQDDIRVVLGELTPVWDTGRDKQMNERIQRFNQGLPALAEQLTGKDSPVVVAHTAADYSPAEDNWDTTHPNARGQVKIAAAFADTLSESLGLGEPYPRPLPDVEVGPQDRTEVSAEENDGAVELTWDPVPGATRYQVLQKRVRPEPDELVALPMEVDGDAGQDGEPQSATVENLLSGATYEFRIRPFKGNDGGRRTEPVRVSVDDDPPGTPESVRIEDDGETLVWSDVAGAGHYEVWRRPLDCEPGTGGEPECEPQDGRDPDSGEGWTVGAVVEDGTEWTISADGGGGYEFVVRAHQDFLAGGYSDPVALDTAE